MNQKLEIYWPINSPSYDLSNLIDKARSINYKKLENDSIGKPLFERGLQGQYAPGSTFKIISTVIGLENVINEETMHRCEGGHFYSKNA